MRLHIVLLAGFFLGACEPRPTTPPTDAPDGAERTSGSESQGATETPPSTPAVLRRGEESTTDLKPQSEDPIDQGWYVDDRDLEDGILRLSGASAPVEGLLLDKDGNPWTGGAMIVLTGEHIEGLFEEVGPDGRFEIHGLPVGAPVEIRASVEPTGSATAQLSGGGTQSITLTLTCPPTSEDPCPPQLEVRKN